MVTFSADPVTPLGRNWRFQLLWIGSTVGFLGIEAADVGYPLAILALTGSPALAGLFGLVQALTHVLLVLPAGHVADRLDRRRILLCAESGRALAAASVAALLIIGHLTLGHLLVVAAILGAGSAFGGPARMLVVRAVVPPAQLTAALTQEQVREGTVVLLGPPLGGLLYAVRQALPFLLSAVAFGVSFLCALVVRLPPRENGSLTVDNGLRGGRLAGVRFLLTNPVLRTCALMFALLNAVGAPLILVAVVLLHEQGAQPTAIGLAMTGLAAGFLVGAPLVRPLHRALRPGSLFAVVFAAEVPAFVLLGIPLGPVWVGMLLAMVTTGLPALKVLVDVLIFRQVPDDVRGRVMAATMVLFGLGAPIGAGATGLSLEYLGSRNTTLILAGTLAIGLCCALGYRPLRHARWPPAEP